MDAGTDPDAIAELVARIDEDTNEDRENDLEVFCEVAWPTLDAQNN